MDNELLLFDRLEVIRKTIEKYGEDNFYLSFSGGKDSMVVHYLLDMAIPNNTIPRVYSNTGIEHKEMVEHITEMQKSDNRIIIIKPSQNIKQTLEKYGYPFKSKIYSHHYAIYKNNKEEIWKYIDILDHNPKLKEDYDYIHNLPYGVKTIIKYIYNLRERERVITKSIDILTIPKCLKYQWKLDLNISDQCCTKLKEEPIKKWEKENNRHNKILGLMREEGGRRATTKCIAFKGKSLSFSPLAKVSKKWEEWFVDKYNVQLCKLYYPPYNFERTGCVGCPFNLNLANDLNKYNEATRKQAEMTWKPVYEEYRRIGYRLKKDEQIKLF